jgi:hypothetical protein
MQAAAMRTRICVDWDSTLAEERWPQVGGWLPGALDALRRLAAEYDEVVIFSCRVACFDRDETTPRDNDDQIRAINNMLWIAGIPGNVYVWNRPFKPPALHYIDDKAIEFRGDWEEVLTRVA